MNARLKVRREEKVSKYIKDRVREGRTLHFTLIDPAKLSNINSIERVAEKLVEAGTDCFMIGGSLGVSERDVDEVALRLKKFGLPVIAFPGNISGLSRYVDAVLFMSLLNSEDPYYIIGAQVAGAIVVAKYGIEALPTGYIVVGYGGTAGYVGRARPIPYEKHEIVVAYALAAYMLGMNYIYLEAGSGAPQPIPQESVKLVKSVIPDAILIVGGGIRDPNVAVRLSQVGADVVVTGNIVEDSLEKAVEIVRAIRSIRKPPSFPANSSPNA
ncbi:MAG: geranylgeranylglyceryl/heptaprenylglyceryl phosphate synthase [Sulfolobales archaeon]|nr:geranylgeranylglyceryl/heptaprenylglyceryl phosphate synthase [Sulfolobales archaeon]MCX8208902.1 geranylgeranylglyceryl/heptaprenylglyceryl phosphate synthase [Sulfolobales archaeon]MDW8010811.1 geranylgeranylglyceryl/heptaprenylglyceryl phosphate synthase [Sulfolobales archaeon]